ncbi:unnamed protein product [Schistosoma mattheei]|uniref:Uncharacterized protein n=1 Tax=Schistosoma mattheei TaxID=31246 RepID=A0A183NKD4_9TREM|nr:unnamed protein product [Schistosoma mattheei]
MGIELEGDAFAETLRNSILSSLDSLLFIEVLSVNLFGQH